MQAYDASVISFCSKQTNDVVVYKLNFTAIMWFKIAFDNNRT